MIKKILLIKLLTCYCWLLSAQNSFIIKGGEITIVDTVNIVLKDCQFQNDGIFTAEKGTLILTGTATTEESEIGGTGTTNFNNLQINKSANDVQLTTDITVGREIELLSGNLDLMASNLTLGTDNGTIIGENESTRITATSTGQVIKTLDLNAPSDTNPGNIGISINSTVDLGSTEIRRGHDYQTIPTGAGIFRHFTINPSNNMGLDASLTFHYLAAELNGLEETALVLLENNGGWMIDGFNNRDATNNTITFSGYDALYQYTLGLNHADEDMDGISASMDNCPDTANAAQEDADNDLVGDVCDVCPNGDDGIDANANDIIDDCECKETDMSLAGTISEDSTYVAEVSITSVEKIESGTNTVYKAAESITLSPGFHAEADATFLAVIADCEKEVVDFTTPPSTITLKASIPPNGSPILSVAPNPFVNTTKINYFLPTASKVTMTIQNMNGQELAVLKNDEATEKGQYQLEWTGINLPAGIYLLVLKDGIQTLTQKLVLTRK